MDIIMALQLFRNKISTIFLTAFLSVVPLMVQAQVKEQENNKADVTEKASNNEDIYENLNLFGDVFERIKSSYVEEVDNKKLIEAAINGMLTSLDPHSGYLDTKRFEEMQVQTNGEFGGLGIEVTLDSGFVKVVSPIDDTPAAKAGIQAGDYITMLDGEQVLGLTLQEAVDKMRGKVGQPIKLTIQREGQAEAINLTLVRAKIEIHAVRSAEYNNVGYLRITTFNSNTYDDLIAEIDKIKKDLGSKAIGFVVDLRNNPGGLLDQAILVSDAFLDTGEIVSTRSRNMEDIKRFNAEKGDAIDGLPIVVLINGGSASASEIVSGALKEHRRAVLVGTKTFGKGSVQSVLPLAGDAGALRLTTARYYTPSGTSIQATGIEPDVLIDAGELNIDKKKQPNLSENDLPGHLLNERQKQEKALKAKEKKVEKSPSGVKIIQDTDLEKDIQLKYALDLIKVMPVVQQVSSHQSPVDITVKDAEQVTVPLITKDNDKSPKEIQKP
jgi:carboxyl-terminal processing protease